jgi:hypothetical protein
MTGYDLQETNSDLIVERKYLFCPFLSLHSSYIDTATFVIYYFSLKNNRKLIEQFLANHEFQVLVISHLYQFWQLTQ